MNTNRTREAIILGVCLCLGLALLGSFLANAVRNAKALDRIVTVKGLAEREVTADIAIWPITFNEANNELTALYSEIERKTGLIVSFLKKHGFTDEEITVSQPSIIDRQAQAYGDNANVPFRFTATTTVTVYSSKVPIVLETMNKVVDLGKEEIAIAGQDYQKQTEFLFTGLNTIKPEMIEEATKNAREVAIKFAKDSQSRLGKIKQADQGQFSINNRDSSTSHIKKVRVVSTITYYLSD